VPNRNVLIKAQETQTEPIVVPAVQTEKTKITGLYGCSCHPFDNWEDCKRAENQKFKVGEAVKASL
jgi:hypothetical protein